MRAAVQKAEELALDVEDRDRAFIDGEEFARARRQLVHRGNDMSRHFIFSRMILFGKPAPTFPDHAMKRHTASARCRGKTRRGWRRKHRAAAPATGRHN